MRIRHYTPADLDGLRRLHAAQGFGYPFPDLESPLFVTKLVLEEDQDDARDEGGDLKGREEAHGDSLLETFPAESLNELSASESLLKTTQLGSRAPRIVMAVLLRLTAEAYLLHDASAGSPRRRWRHLLAIHEATRREAADRGLDDVQAFLPPCIARAFGRRLARLGWRQDPWPCFTRMIGG